MQKHQLAQELRERQYAAGLVDRRMVDALSDDEIIDCYITCSECGQRQVTAKEQEAAIRFASDANEFFDLCDQFAEGRPHAH
jgi:hypothetical protein